MSSWHLETLLCNITRSIIIWGSGYRRTRGHTLNSRKSPPYFAFMGDLCYVYREYIFALLCFVVVIHWLIFPYPSGLLYRHCGNLTIAPVPAKQPWWIWINTSREFIMNDCITATKQSTTKPCAYFLGYTYDAVMIWTRFLQCLPLVIQLTNRFPSWMANKDLWCFRCF